MELFLPGPGGNLFFNVSARVGKGQLNDVIDVQLVQFFLKQIGEQNGLRNDPEALAICRAVNPTGTVDDATVAAITAFQQHRRRKHPNTVADGIISPARGGTGGLYAEGTPWAILPMNTAIRTAFPELWPRLQDIPGCPTLVAAKTIESV